jgi:hypothetical protein
MNAAYSPANSMALSTYANNKNNWENAKRVLDNLF